MMFNHIQAVISYCPDLTDPFALSLPVAVFFVGEAGPQRVFLLAALGLNDPSKASEFEPFGSLIEGLKRLMPDHVREMQEREGPAIPVDRFVSSMAALLRNSLHVSQIRPLSGAEVAVPGDTSDHRLVYNKLLAKAMELTTATLHECIDRTYEEIRTTMGSVLNASLVAEPVVGRGSFAGTYRLHPSAILRLKDELSDEPCVQAFGLKKLRAAQTGNYLHN